MERKLLRVEHFVIQSPKRERQTRYEKSNYLRARYLANSFIHLSHEIGSSVGFCRLQVRCRTDSEGTYIGICTVQTVGYCTRTGDTSNKIPNPDDL
jgi:hypothetical protein